MGRAVDAAVEPSFVGRGRELDAVETAVRAAVRGEAPGVLVIGEAGVGKTRLIAELATTARQSGVRVVWSSVSEPAAARAHGHWAQVLRILAASPPSSSTRTRRSNDAARTVSYTHLTLPTNREV